MDEQTPVIRLKGIGEKTEKLFARLHIHTVGDLLTYYPRDYEVFEEPVPISQTQTGSLVSVLAYITGTPSVKKTGSLTIVHANGRDSSGDLRLIFFNMPYVRSILKSGSAYIFRGTVQVRGSARLMEQPTIFTRNEYDKLTGGIKPRYGLTKGLTNQAVKRAVEQALTACESLEEWLPEDVRLRLALMDYREAVCTIHFPPDWERLIQARRRLAFNEFFLFMLDLSRQKVAVQRIPNAWPMRRVPETARFLTSMPFSLTGAQRKVWEEVQTDLEGPFCMNRLIQGDVGSGKTIVAFLALLLCACNGFQGALMAPTEVLAQQHYETFCRYCEAYSLPVVPVLLVGSMNAAGKREVREKISSGEANLVIGTHALIQDKVQFHALGLVVTDEQHRFGVRQREKLSEKGILPHILVMSATPIPRTLAIILYGDLQISVIDELPAKRLPIKSCVVGTAYRPTAYRFIAGQIAGGHQAYCICPAVEAGELEGVENVTDYTLKLRTQLPPEITIAGLHGRMKPEEKTRIMREFADGRIQVLVSTTVVEVGIDVPNATVMLVENAERFGLAQLHQLRGRVGRGDAQSYCIFFTAREDEETKKRLDILNHSNDGFHIASEDLKLRGPGDLFGVRQSGQFAFRIGDIYNDASLLKDAGREAEEILAKDPELSAKEHTKLRERVEQFSRESVDFRSI